MMWEVIAVGHCECGLQVVKVKAPHVKGPRRMLRQVIPGFGKRSGVWLHLNSKGQVVRSPSGKHFISGITHYDRKKKEELIEAMKEQQSPPLEAADE